MLTPRHAFGLTELDPRRRADQRVDTMFESVDERPSVIPWSSRPGVTGRTGWDADAGTVDP